jgi:hypothetical protein
VEVFISALQGVCLQLEVDAMLLLAPTAPAVSSNDCHKQPLCMLEGFSIALQKVAPGPSALPGIFPMSRLVDKRLEDCIGFTDLVKEVIVNRSADEFQRFPYVQSLSRLYLLMSIAR